MKMKSVQFLLLILLFTFPATSQVCEVNPAALKGKYEGECKNGKADGIGKAEGIDAYEGMFKASLPHGQGKYLWKNGDIFSGNWVKGNKDGQGVFIYKTSLGTDSTVEGFWKKDKYIGKYEQAFSVLNKSVHVTSVQIRKINGAQKQVDIYLDSETGKQVGSFGGTITPPVLTDISLVNGTYQKLVQNPNLGKKVFYSLEDVTFPFRALFRVDNDLFEVEFFEPGKWTLDVRMSF